MKHIEEREFNLRLVLRVEFPEDYEGELDGYSWTEEMPPIVAELIRSAATTLAHRPGWQMRGGNRGRSPEDEVTLVLVKTLPSSGEAGPPTNPSSPPPG